MWRFWQSYIEPVMRAVAPRRVMEIGADDGYNTRRLLAFCRETGARADIVDPAPSHRLKDAIEAHPIEAVYHKLPSLEAIPKAPAPDIVLLDGDHNWRTVYEEFTALYEKAAKEKVEPPVILFHDAAWPYARRDMYYAPERIEQEFRHPYAFKGLEPGRSELIEGGLNAHFANATHEGGARNGVLTGAEDFINEWPAKIHFRLLPFFNGLGISAPEGRMTPKLQETIDSFFTPDALLKALTELEGWNARLLIELQKARLNYDKRTDALKRARQLLQDRAETIAALEAELAKKKP
jgi:hypothetical protein